MYALVDVLKSGGACLWAEQLTLGSECAME